MKLRKILKSKQRGFILLNGGGWRSWPGNNDSVPNAFSFIAQSDVALNTVITSAPVTITGINVPVTFTAVGGTIDVNGDGNFQSSRTVSNGDAIRARLTSSNNNSTVSQCIVSSGGVSAAFVVTTEVAAGSDADADWASRSASAFYANNFSTFSNNTELHASNYGGTASGYQSRTTLETRAGVSGKVCRLHITKEANEGTPSYRHSWDGVGAQTKSVLKKKFFYQWQMYIPAYVLDHRFRTDSRNPPQEPADLTSSVAMKFVIFQEPDQSFGSGEVVVTNERFRGFVTAYRHTGPSTLNFQQSVAGIPGGGSPDYRWQNAIDTGEPITDNASARRRYGPLHYSFSGTNNYGTSLSVQGNPDPEAAVNGVTWVPDAWNVVEVEIDAENDTFRLWHAVRGNPPKLVHEWVGNANIGERTDNYRGAQLLPRLEQLIADPTREDTFVDYAELIASDEPIDFPGGYKLNPDQTTAPEWLESMDVGTWYTISGSSPDLELTATNVPTAVNPDPTGSQPYNGNSGFGSIWSAWNSAAYAPDVGQSGSMLHYGGGHHDYYGNGIVRFDLATRTWSMLSMPSTAGPFSTGASTPNGEFLDGTPNPTHTYDFLQYDVASSSLICLQSTTTIGGTSMSLAIPHLYSTVDDQWRRGATGTGIALSLGGGSSYDENRQGFWTVDIVGGEFGLYRPAGSGEWTIYSQSQPFNLYTALVYDPVLDVLLVIDGNGTVYRKDPNDMSANRTTVSFSGATITNQSSWQYSHEMGGIVYHRRGTGEVYLVTTDDNYASATATSLTQSNNSKSFSVQNGMYGRSRTVAFGEKVIQIASLMHNTPVLAMRLK